MERSVLWRGGNGGATPLYGTHGGSPAAREAACPGTPRSRACRSAAVTPLVRASLSAPDGAMVVPWVLEEEGV